MRYFIFLDNRELLRVVAGLAGAEDDQVFVSIGNGLPGDIENAPGRIFQSDTLDLELVASLNISCADRVVICAENMELFTPLVDTLSGNSEPPSILLLTERPTGMRMGALPNVSIVNLHSMAQRSLGNEWRALEIRQKAYRLWKLLEGTGSVAIMTQNDPDPDAIASGMAVQALIMGDDERTPICTLGEVTRNENLNMIQTLGTCVRTVTPKQVAGFDKIVMVDVQPPYFPKGLFKRVDAVIDHHPYPSEYESEFIDVNVSYGATATMMSEYLSAGGINIPERLATALLYGVITDTMLLARESSSRDFEAFSMLWPIANHHLLANMSRPRLQPDELKYFVKAIKNRQVQGDLLFIWLDEVKREDIIPRLADFSLQIGETTVSAVGGIYKGRIDISIRSVNPYVDAGKLAANLFSKYGSAGGHKSMAKAVFDLAEFKKAMNIKSMKRINMALLDIFDQALE